MEHLHIRMYGNSILQLQVFGMIFLLQTIVVIMQSYDLVELDIEEK